MPSGLAVQPCQVSRISIRLCHIIHVQPKVVAQYVSIGQLVHLGFWAILLIRLAVYAYLVLF